MMVSYCLCYDVIVTAMDLGLWLPLNMLIKYYRLLSDDATSFLRLCDGFLYKMMILPAFDVAYVA